jgi:hypothetical protein
MYAFFRLEDAAQEEEDSLEAAKRLSGQAGLGLAPATPSWSTLGRKRKVGCVGVCEPRH